MICCCSDPRRLPELIDNERNPAHDKKSYNQEDFVKQKTSCFELRRRKERHEDRKSRRQYAKSCSDPHTRHFVGDSIGPMNLWFRIPKFNARNKHHDIHHKVALR